MRVIVTADELDALGLGAAVLDIAGVVRTKRARDSHLGAGWTEAGRTPLSAIELADGKPMVVLYDPKDPRPYISGLAAGLTDFRTPEELLTMDFLACWTRRHPTKEDSE